MEVALAPDRHDEQPETIGSEGGAVMIGLRRERKQIGALALGLLGVLLLCRPATAETTLKVIPHADLQVLDPVVSAATITADHSYMVYDQLFALDDAYKPQPQMIDSWSL